MSEPNPTGGHAEAVGASAMRSTSRVAIGVAFVLIAIKLWAWWVTSSVALLAALTDSCLDLLASSINAWAIHHALEPPDREHRFGHGKLESLAGLAQSILVAGSALFVAVEGVRRILNPEPLTHGAAAVAAMVVSIVATAWLVRLQRRTIASTHSVAIAADSLHYQGDIAMNVGVILGIGASALWGVGEIDGIAALIIALWIARSAWQIAREALAGLLDTEIDDEERSRIIAVVSADRRILGVHDLRTRRSGPFLFATMHLEVDGTLSLRAAHPIVANAERALRKAFPSGHFMLHIDPDDHEAEDPFGDRSDTDTPTDANVEPR